MEPSQKGDDMTLYSLGREQGRLACAQCLRDAYTHGDPDDPHLLHGQGCVSVGSPALMLGFAFTIVDGEAICVDHLARKWYDARKVTT